MSTAVQGAQINFGDLTPYLTCAVQLLPYIWSRIWTGKIKLQLRIPINPEVPALTSFGSEGNEWGLPLSEEKAKQSNLTVAVSFGLEREAAFEHAKTKVRGVEALKP
jgi:hypothetical protein